MVEQHTVVCMLVPERELANGRARAPTHGNGNGAPARPREARARSKLAFYLTCNMQDTKCGWRVRETASGSGAYELDFPLLKAS